MSKACDLFNVVSVMNQELKPDLFRDYAPNGLQVEGRRSISRIVTGVTACEALIDAAIEQSADAIIVHHGYFWKGEDPAIRGMKAKRIKKLLGNDMSLIAYHLPLDAHRTLGNNWQLGERLGFDDIRIMKSGNIRVLENNNTQLLFTGIAKFDNVAELGQLLEQQLQRKPMLVQGDPARKITRIAWCTGGAQGVFLDAAYAGADVFITGEVSEKTYHEAQETGVHFIAAGHHATERYGIQALGSWLESRFSLQVMYIDIDNPV